MLSLSSNLLALVIVFCFIDSCVAVGCGEPVSAAELKSLSNSATPCDVPQCSRVLVTSSLLPKMENDKEHQVEKETPQQLLGVTALVPLKESGTVDSVRTNGRFHLGPLDTTDGQSTQSAAGYCVRGLSADERCTFDSDCDVGLACRTRPLNTHRTKGRFVVEDAAANNAALETRAQPNNVDNEQAMKATKASARSDVNSFPRKTKQNSLQLPEEETTDAAPVDSASSSSGGSSTVKVCVKSEAVATRWKGYVAAAVAVLAFGSNFIFAKNVELGNGLLYQFAMACGILIVGIVVQLARGAMIFYPYAMIGGVLWCSGNTLAVPIIRLSGMGLAVTTWGVTNMLTGWASGKFGFWGVSKETAGDEWLSYVGVGVGSVAIVALAFVQPTVRVPEEELNTVPSSESDRLGWSPTYGYVDEISAATRTRKEAVGNAPAPATAKVDSLSGLKTRVLGVVLALIAGILFGLSFNPPEHLMDHAATLSRDGDVKYSSDGLDYVMSHCLGIFATAVMFGAMYLILHDIFSRDRTVTIFAFVATRMRSVFNCCRGESNDATYDSHVYLPMAQVSRDATASAPTTLLDRLSFFPEADPYAALPRGFFSGVLWAVGNVAWFVANTNLGLSVSFPIICLGPGLVACLWGVFVFGEIRGKKNGAALAISFVLIAASCTATVLAKEL